MKIKAILVLIVFIISMFLVACSKNELDVKGYREGLKKSQKKSMPIEQKKKIEKSIFPNIKQK